MSNVIKSRKGASSILVILLLVVLVVFGVAALTTALSNLRLGQKAADWNDKYYAADAKANEMYAHIDKAVTDWQTSRLQYFGIQDSGVDKFIEELGFDVLIKTSGDTIDFMYEAREEDIGISVVLSYDIKKSSFSVKQYKAVQE